MSESSTPSTVLFIPSVSTTPVFGFFALSTLDIFWLSLYTSTPGRQTLIELNRRKMRVISYEELAIIFTCQLFFSQLSSSLFFFPSSYIGKKQSFNKEFNINSRLLAKDHTEKKVDLSFTCS